MGRGPEGLGILREVRREAVSSGNLWLLVHNDISYGVALVQAGEMGAGVRCIEASMQRFAEWGNDWQPTFGHMVLGEIYLQMVLREQKVTIRIILRNLGFVLRIFPVAAAKARHHLEEAIRRARDGGMPGAVARSLFDLGLLCKAKSRLEEARTYIEEALKIAGPHSAVLGEKIHRALDSLDH
jgi:hypothetical protein